MDWKSTAFGNIHLAISLIIVVVIVDAWRFRRKEGIHYLIGLLASEFIWILFAGMEINAGGIDQKLVWAQFGFIGVVSTAPAWFLFSLHYCDYRSFLTKQNIALLFTIPAIAFIGGITNDLHHLAWTANGIIHNDIGSFIVYKYGPIVWIVAIYSYVMLTLGTFFIFKKITMSLRLFWVQKMLFLISALIPWLSSIIYLGNIGPAGIDFTPMSFAFSSLVLWLAIRKYGLVEVVPIARNVLFTTISDLVFVIDNQKRIAEMNPAAQQFLGLDRAPLGKTIEAVFGHNSFLLNALKDADTGVRDELFSDNPKQWFEIRNTALHNNGHHAGNLFVLRDITQRKFEDEEKEKLIGSLQEALANVKTLSGLLPICSKCHKIRDDQGYWGRVEEYISQHTDARFSHGFCPDCLSELFPDLKKKS